MRIVMKWVSGYFAAWILSTPLSLILLLGIVSTAPKLDAYRHYAAGAIVRFIVILAAFSLLIQHKEVRDVLESNMFIRVLVLGSDIGLYEKLVADR